MAKDPAFLFYPGDWLGGTMGMTFEEKGAYLELLLYQFNNGKFNKAQAKQVLSICSASVFDKVLQKFDTDGTVYWKQKLSDEVDRRKKFSESRRNNAKSNKDSKAYAKHMETETETIKYIIVSGQKILNATPILEFYEAQLNGTMRENNNIAWKPLVSVWFDQHQGEEFKDNAHVKNSFKRYYLSKKVSKEVTAIYTKPRVFGEGQ